MICRLGCYPSIRWQLVETACLGWVGERGHDGREALPGQMPTAGLMRLTAGPSLDEDEVSGLSVLAQQFDAAGSLDGPNDGRECQESGFERLGSAGFRCHQIMASKGHGV